MEISHYVNWNSIIYRKIEIHRTEIERLFLTAKSFNINLVQFLMLYHDIISKLHVCSFTYTSAATHANKSATQKSTGINFFLIEKCDVYWSFKDKIWGADRQLISKCNKRIRFLFCVLVNMRGLFHWNTKKVLQLLMLLKKI